jgi:hypothetical protein
MACSYKGAGPVSARYARGGPPITTKSKFIKTPDTFRTSIQRQDYEKKTPGGEQSKTIEKKA